MKYVFFLFSFFIITTGFSQEIALKKGEVIDGIKINDSINEDFAIYLPTNFNKQQSWPILFVFDPEGRGRSATQLFRQAAEEQGYIVAASNNINKKDSLVANLRIASRLMGKIFNYFPIDVNRVYTAGFAEGGQVASAVPAIYSKVQGVIAVSDAWINTDFIKQNGDFSFIGLVGTQDYRLYAMKDIVDFLNKSGQFTRLYTFDGGYQWPDSYTISRALSTYTLSAIAKGFAPKDTLLVNKLYEERLKEATTLRRKMEPYKAYEYLEQMEDNFSVFGKKDELDEQEKYIKRNTDYRKIRNKYIQANIEEEDKKEEYLYFFNNDIASASFDNLGYWEQQIQDLKKMQEGDDPAEAAMAYRLQGMLAGWAKNAYIGFNQEKASIDRLIFSSILSTIFDKNDPKAYLHIISLSAKDGDDYTALLYLEDLLKTGYKNLEALYDIPGTLELKLTPKFNELIKKYLGESKYYDIKD